MIDISLDRTGGSVLHAGVLVSGSGNRHIIEYLVAKSAIKELNTVDGAGGRLIDSPLTVRMSESGLTRLFTYRAVTVLGTGGLDPDMLMLAVLAANMAIAVLVEDVVAVAYGLAVGIAAVGAVIVNEALIGAVGLFPLGL